LKELVLTIGYQNTVNIQKPDHPVKEWSFFEQKFSLEIQWLAIRFSPSKTRPKIKFSAKLESFIKKK
jgi:hypothetical protein